MRSTDMGAIKTILNRLDDIDRKIGHLIAAQSPQKVVWEFKRGVDVGYQTTVTDQTVMEQE